MSDNAITIFGRGKTFLKGGTRTPPTTYATDVALEGVHKRFADLDYGTTGTGARNRRSGGEVMCICVRNASGIALKPKFVVTWKSGYIGARVDGYCTTDYANVAGVVDEWLPSAGVATDDLFWIAVKGPSLVKTSLGADATNVITAGTWLAALTAATSQATTSGRVQMIASTSNVTNAVSAVLNRIGLAMSAKTTANTNADVLVELALVL